MPYGIDLSLYQRKPDYNRLKAAGVGFAIARAGGGDNLIDSEFARNWGELHRVGIPAGTYFFHRPEDDAEAQADLYYRIVGDLSPGDIMPWIDVEWYSYRRTNLAPAVQNLAMLILYCEERFGKPVGIYTAAWAWNPLPIANPDRWRNIPLWVASYNTVGRPILPKTWTSWSIQQFTSTGEIDGISGYVDRNYTPALEALRRPRPVNTRKDDMLAALAQANTSLAQANTALSTLGTLIREM